MLVHAQFRFSNQMLPFEVCVPAGTCNRSDLCLQVLSMQPSVIPSAFAVTQVASKVETLPEADHSKASSVKNLKPIAESQLHAVGSVADMSAAWSAKVAVTAAAQVLPTIPQILPRWCSWLRWPKLSA